MTTEALKEVSCGIDLHASNVYVAIMNKEGQTLYQRRHHNELNTVLDALRSVEQLEHVTVESTYNWYWLVDGLMEAGYQVHLANPAKMKDCAAPKYTDDRHDAKKLAWLLLHDQLPEGFIYPKEVRPMRDVLRRRLLISRQHTQTMLSLQSMVARHTGHSVSGSKIKKWTREEIRTTFSNEIDQFAANQLLEMTRAQERHIREMEEYLKKYLKDVPYYRQLQYIYGIGQALALTITLETGPIERFSKASQYASYCRTVPSRATSAGKKKGENNKRNGNKYLGWAFVEAANYAQRYHPLARSWFDRKVRRSNRCVAIKSLASKLSKSAFYMLRDNVDFDEHKLFG